MEWMPLGFGGVRNPIMADFFAAGRKVKILCEGPPPGDDLSNFNPIVIGITGQPSRIGVAVTNDHFNSPEFRTWCASTIPIPTIGTVTCSSYQSFVFWSIMLVARRPECGGFVVNPPIAASAGYGILFGSFEDMRMLAPSVGIESVKLDTLILIARGG